MLWLWYHLTLSLIIDLTHNLYIHKIAYCLNIVQWTWGLPVIVWLWQAIEQNPPCTALLLSMMNNDLRQFSLFILLMKRNTENISCKRTITNNSPLSFFLKRFTLSSDVLYAAYWLLSFFPFKASHSVISIQFLMPSPAVERVILNFQFKGFPWCSSEHQRLYFLHKLMTALSSRTCMKSGMKYLGIPSQ